MTVSHRSIELTWFGYATLRLRGRTGVTVYIDPGRYGVLDDRRPEDGDLVLVSHDDHYDPDGIERVAHDDAIVVVHEAIDADEIDRVSRQPSALPYDVESVSSDEAFALGPLDLFTTPAYNRPGGPHTREDGTPYHPKGTGCGFGVTIDGVTVFWPGDTDVIPPLETIDIDVLCPPIGGSFTMDRHEAAALAREIRPDLVVPIHYDTFDAIETDAVSFLTDVGTSGIPVALDG